MSKHCLARGDVPLQVLGRLEVVDVKKDTDLRQQQLELPLNRRHQVLCRRPRVAEEEVPPEPGVERKAREQPARIEPDPANLVLGANILGDEGGGDED